MEFSKKPDHEKNYDECLEIVQRFGASCISFIPEEYKNFELIIYKILYCLNKNTLILM